VTPRDVFPPASPRDLVVLLVPAAVGTPTHVELSWSINTEPDLAGYYVYLSETQESGGERGNRELLLAPTFRDMSVVPGRRYSYRVTVVDRAGNESPPSAAVSVVIPDREREP
jgi:fibronectin type 3 domain-containing protein